eukprot:CAMPEP_0119086838 /NCGR_PEP_ID=MMETSP1178-20130426/139502_1 /TAXON_ID=33656 /ORGANISM="unid sp, Strain CCMP2000" /LENGTH=334 /DNA_ID=CAMNT_0007069999 /DNA_START=37 /DNA_END=1041 /DNA_ORIENTATION=+
MSVTVKLRDRSVTVSLPPTLGELRSAIRCALELPTGSLRLLSKGKVVDGDNSALPADVGIKDGAKLMAMFSAQESLDAASVAKPERLRGFEEGDMQQRTGGLGGRGSGVARGPSTASSYRFHRTQALEPATTPQFAMGATPGPDAAAVLLRRLASDSCILSLMEKRRWSVGLLAEMPPQGLVGVSSSCLMGLNRNRGQSIHLRLRTDDWEGLRPYEKLVEVLLHELTHNRFDDHDDDFKALNSELRREYMANLAVYRSARSAGDGPVAAAFTLAEAGHAEYTLGGGEGVSTLDPRAAAARAALERAEGSRVQDATQVACLECDEPTDEGTPAQA